MCEFGINVLQLKLINILIIILLEKDKFKGLGLLNTGAFIFGGGLETIICTNITWKGEF